MEKTEETLLTAEEVGARLRVRPRNVYELVRRGELTGIFVGRYLRVAPADLAAYLDRQRTTQPEAPVVALSRRV